jgi:protein-L-isoaspartate(D-aspartate) O-methyltransferase
LTVGVDTGDETLALIYRATEPLITRGSVDGHVAISSLSAPIVVALMLVELGLRPGLRVLEIGAGSGYHAALMATLVANAADVTSLDIDAALVSETRARLDRLGFGALTVLAVDGAEGAPERAPFDRIVATVGCVDLAPAWLTQLAPGGGLLVPLEHGNLHPRVAVHFDDAVTGRFTGHSGFVRMQGRQEASRLWPFPPTLEPDTTEALGSELRGALAPPGPTHPHRMSGLWNLAVYLALRDRRAAGVGLIEHDSSAVVHGDELFVSGPRGPVLRDRLMAVAADWLGLGALGIERYAMQFVGRSTSASEHPPDHPTGPWRIERIDHCQIVSLGSR